MSGSRSRRPRTEPGRSRSHPGAGAATYDASIVIEPHQMDPGDEILLTLPSLTTYARVARLAVTGLASRLGYTYDDIEDLRIAIGEVAGLLLDDGEGRVTLSCRVRDDQLRITTSRRPAEGPLTVSDLSNEILTAVVDELDIDRAKASITIVKQRQG